MIDIVKKLLKEKLDIDEVSENSTLEELDLDSLDTSDLLMRLEDELEINIPDIKLNGSLKIIDLVKEIENGIS